MQDTLLKLRDLFISPRFITFYWNSGYIVAVGLFDLISQSLGMFNMPEWLVVLLGLAFAQISKALKNKADNKPMGFAK